MEPDMRIIAGIAAVLIAVILASTAYFGGTRNTTTCGYPRERSGPCRQPYREGKPCPKGHTRNWVRINYLVAFAFMVISVGIFGYGPLSGNV